MKPLAVSLALVSLILSGCFTSRELASYQREIVRNNPEVDLRRNFVLNLGPGTIHMLERASGIWEADQPIEVRDYLSDIDRVKIGVYDVRHRRGSLQPTTYSLPVRQGWTPAVIVREDGEATSILYRETRRSVRDLLVVHASDEQVVVVRLEGNLGRLLRRAMDDRARIIGQTPGSEDTRDEPHARQE
jgi:hypothetical protein